MNAAEWLLLSTIRIETTIPNGISTGTGFFFSFCVEEETGTRIPTIVTNKHVIKDAINGKLKFSLKDTNGDPIWGEFYDLKLNDFEKRWILHPDPNIDLCILPIANIHNEIKKAQKELYYTTLTLRDIPCKDEIANTISRIEDITVVGYPDGIWDSYNNMPIVRKGITATSLQLDFNNEPKFLIDAAIYGGAIGSYSGSLKIDGAKFNDNLSTNFGGAISITAKSEVKITNSEFNRNSAKNGGAIHHNGSSTHKLMIERVKFLNNTADSSGGALNLGFETDISECEFTGNGGYSTRWGGAIVASFKEVAKTLNVNKSKFDENKAALGGGISLYGGTLNINETEFNNNMGAPYEKDGDYDLGGGGAIVLLKKSDVSNVLNIKDSQVIGNKARYGAGILVEEGTLDIQSTVFNGNSTEGPDEAHPGRQGGGLYLFEEASATISNGTKFIKNKASWGGAIYTSSHDQGNNPIDETKYKNLKTDVTTLFTENWAANGLYEPPKNFADFSNLKFNPDSDVLHGVLNSKSLINNYDINYENPEKVIIYDANGGKFTDNEVIKRILYPVNEKIKIYEAPTREGWTFDYWKGSGYQPGDSYTVVEDHLFTAQWKNESPKIEVEDKTIEKGTALDLKELIISATDKEDGDLKSKVELIDDGGFDKNKVGKYTITFKVTDKDGASTTKKATVTVTEKDKPTPDPDDNKPKPNPDNNKPQAPDNKILPKTGNGTNISLYSMMAVLSGVLLIVFGVRKRRKES